MPKPLKVPKIRHSVFSLIALILIFSFIILLVCYTSYSRTHDQTVKMSHSMLKSVSRLSALSFSNELDNKVDVIGKLVKRKEIINLISSASNITPNHAHLKKRNILKNRMFNLIKDDKIIRDLSIHKKNLDLYVDNDGTFLNTEDDKRKKIAREFRLNFKGSEDRKFYIFRDNSNYEIHNAIVGFPVSTAERGSFLVLMRLDIRELYKSLGIEKKLYDVLETSDIYLVNKKGKFLSKLRYEEHFSSKSDLVEFNPEQDLNRKDKITGKNIYSDYSYNIDKIRNIQNGISYQDYRNVQVLGSVAQIPDTPWLLISEIDMGKATEVLVPLKYGIIILFLVLAVILPVMVIVIARQGARRLEKIFKDANVVFGKHDFLMFNKEYYAKENTDIVFKTRVKNLLDPFSVISDQLVNLIRVLDVSTETRQHLLEKSNDIMYCQNKEGILTYVSPSVTKITGHSIEHWLRDYKELLTDSPINEKCIENTEIALSTGEGMPPYVCEIFAANGERIFLELREQPFVRDDEVLGLVGFATDVTDRIKYHKESEFLRRSVDSAAESIIMTDRHACIHKANPAFTLMTGYDLEEVYGQNMRFLKSGKHSTAFYKDMWTTILAGNHWKGELFNQTKDGKIYKAKTSISPVFENYEITGFIATQEDITEIYELQLQLQQAQRLEAVGALAAGISHEINTPIQFVINNINFICDEFRNFENLMILYKDLMLKSLAKEDTSNLIEKIKKLDSEIETDYLLEEFPKAMNQSREGLDMVVNVIKAMRSFARTGERVQEKELYDINTIINNAVTISSYLWKNKTELVLELSEEELKVNCFVNEMHQVIINLINNSVDAIVDFDSPDEDYKGVIKISTKLSNNTIKILISDNGCGIPKDIQDKIFNPFFSTKDVGKGTGQGLPIVHSIIVEKHQGSIFVNSDKGAGTEIEISLPLK